MKTVLYLTDFYYPARERNYYEEDLYLIDRLRKHLNILIGHPHQAIAHLGCADFIVFRNTGAVTGYQDYFNEFVKEVTARKLTTFNSFDGKSDIKGKQYLLDLTDMNYPVIPTIDSLDDLSKLGRPEQYFVKPKYGADSVGVELLNEEELLLKDLRSLLIQPYVEFEHEVSFYYLNDVFQYALYTPDAQKRWALKEYEPTEEDLEFAGKFVRWNAMTHGIQRVDACRLKDGSLLLLEVEDLNPFLSIDLLSEKKREAFIDNFIEALEEI